jgi:hypothetical protein
VSRRSFVHRSELRWNPGEHQTRLWRMKKRIRKKFHRELETLKWLWRLRALGGPRMRRATIVELERFLLVCAGVVVGGVLLRCCV